jgi:hypothetical protein
VEPIGRIDRPNLVDEALYLNTMNLGGERTGRTSEVEEAVEGRDDCASGGTAKRWKDLLKDEWVGGRTVAANSSARVWCGLCGPKLRSLVVPQDGRFDVRISDRKRTFP